MICKIKTSLEANQGSVCNLHKCDVETESLQCTDTGDELYNEGGNFCLAVKLLNENVHIHQL